VLDIANRGRRTYLLGIVLLLAATPAPACDKTDVLTLENGDHLIGEIIQLERGRLEIATDAIGTVYMPKSLQASTRQRLLIDYSERFFLQDTRLWAILGSLEPNTDWGITVQSSRASAARVAQQNGGRYALELFFAQREGSAS